MWIYSFYLFLFNGIITYKIFHFSKKNSPELTSKYFIYNDLHLNISIGNPIQTIKGIIDYEERGLYIPNILVNGYYNENKSSTYIFEYENKSYIIQRIFNYGGNTFLARNSNEKILLNNGTSEISYNNFKFFLLTSNISNQSLETALIGLKPKTYEDQFNFLSQLNEKNIISFNYEDEIKGKFILGIYPHEINNNLDSNSILFIKAEKSFSDWNMEFTNITYGNTSNPILKATFSNNIKGIISNMYYYSYINNSFFKNFFSQKKCSFEKIDNKYNKFSQLIIFYCDKDINIKNFENLEFFSKEMNYTFIFDYKDLFKTYNNKYVFLVFFDNSFSEKWKLGEIFIKKYNVFLDMDSKLFGFYTRNNIKSYSFYYIFIISFLLFIIFVLVFCLFKQIIKIKKRKIRANELEDNYEYISSLNN